MNRTPVRLAALAALLLAGPASAQEAEEGAAIRRIHAITRSSMVGLEIHLRKKTKLERAESEEAGRGDRELDRKAEMQVTHDAWGVVIDGAGTIAMANPGVKVADVVRIAGTAPDGTTFEAQIQAVGRRYDSLLLKADKALPGSKAVEFAAFEPFALGTRFFMSYLERVDARWHVNVAPYVVTNAPLVEGKGGWFCVDRIRQGALIFDAKGRPVGIPFDDYLWTDGKTDSFVGAGLVADGGLPVEEYRTARDRVAKGVEAAAHRIELFLRGGSERGDSTPKITLFGLPVDDRGTLLVPANLPAEIIRRTESIKSTPPGGTPGPCAFVGRLKAFSAMLLRAEQPGTPAPWAAEAKNLERSVLHFVVTVEEKFGGTWVEADANRIFRTDKGLKGGYRSEFRHPARLGSFVCDLEGRLLGIYTTDRKEDDLEEAGTEEELQEYMYRRRGGGWTPDHLRRIRLLDELKPILQKPDSHIDPRALPVAKSEERRMVWLGIEFHELSKGLAQLWGLEDKDLTNDGKRGLLVTDVYAGSPAARAGLKVEDILLTVKPPGSDAKPIDLSPERERYHRFMDRDGPTPWKARRNYLTLMLTQIGAGKEIELEVLRGREKRMVKLTLEDEPVSFESAERHKDNGLGLTVKELTYEVRYFNKLEPAATGVVIAKVENGSRAEVAKVWPLSLITRVNDQTVKDIKDFSEKIRAARAAGAKTATLTTQAMGQTRLADVELGEE